MTEYSKVARGHFTSTGAQKMINLPFQPSIVELFNYSSANSGPVANNVVSAYWDFDMGQGFAMETGVYSAAGTFLESDTVVANGISTFAAGISLQYGPKIQIVSATAANPIVFTVAANTFSVGDVVTFSGLYQSATTGMPQIDGMPFRVSAVSSTTFSVVWPGAGSNYTALSGSPSGAYVRKILYPYLYAPGTAFIEAITTGTTTTVVTTAPHNFVVGQEIAFRVPKAWGTVELNSLPDVTIPGSPIYYYVTSVTNATTFVCNANSTNATAFNTNQTVASVPGLSFPQVVAVGDINTGGFQYSGTTLYPPPYTVLTGTTQIPTINGPAIQGAYFNNTSQGFIIGIGAGTNITGSTLVGTNGQIIYWRASSQDINVVG
jgi:hypothetical protein